MSSAAFIDADPARVGRRSLRAVAMLLTLAGLSSVTVAVPVAQRELDWVLKRTPDAGNGAKLYETCAACHGPRGEGVADGTVPAIGGQHFTIVAKQLVDFRTGVRSDSRMEHFSDSRHLAYSQYIADVAAYVSSLAPPAPQSVTASESIAQGAVLYTRACERCHGAAGEGKEDGLAPRIAAQHLEYLIRQLDDAAAGRRPAMLGAHQGLLAGLSRADVVAVASFLASAGAIGQ